MNHPLITRLAHLVTSREPGAGLLVLVEDAPRGFFDNLSRALAGERVHRLQLLPHNREQPGSVRALLSTRPAEVTIVDDLDFIDDLSLEALLTAVHQGPHPRPVILASAAEERITRFASATFRLRPFSLAELAAHVRDRTGTPIPVAELSALRRRTGGRPDRVDAFLDSHPADHWHRDPDPDPTSLAAAEEHARRGEVAAAWVHLADPAAPAAPGPEERERRAALAGYLSLYSGHRQQARQLIGPGSMRAALLALADWQPTQLLQRATEAATYAAPGTDTADEANALVVLGRTVLTGVTPKAVPRMHTRPGRQRLAMVRGWAALAHDDPVAAREHLRIRSGESPLLRIWQDAWLARTLYVLGDLAGAAATVERGLASAESRGVRLLEPLLLWTGAQTAGMRGETLLSRYYLSRMTVGEDAFLLQRLPAAMGRMIVTASSADLPVALRAGAELARIVSLTDTQHPGFWPWEDIYAHTLLRAGRVEEADEVISAAEERHRPSGLASLNAKNATVRASLQLQRGEKKSGFATFDSAVAALEGRHMPTYLARVLFEYGQALRRYGRRSQADEIFARAGEVYAEIGAPVMVRRCDSERRASGVGERLESRLGLTPQEEQIALLVADGASNRSVAQQLTLSTKTVEYHLTRVYKKLGVTDRRGLRGLFDPH